MYNRSHDLQNRGFGPFAVHVIPHKIIRVENGSEIAIRIWFPEVGHKEFEKDEGYLYCGKDESSKFDPEVNMKMCIHNQYELN